MNRLSLFAVPQRCSPSNHSPSFALDAASPVFSVVVRLPSAPRDEFPSCSGASQVVHTVDPHQVHVGIVVHSLLQPAVTIRVGRW